MYVLILPLIKGKNMAIHNASSASGFKNNGGTALKAGVPYSGNASTVKTFSNDRRADNYPFGSTLVNYAHLTSIDSNPLIPSPSKYECKKISLCSGITLLLCKQFN